MKELYTKWYFWLVMLILIFSIVVVYNANAETTVKITLQNCYPYYWVGGVKWNDDHTDYTDLPEFELKEVGIKEVELIPGDYAITVFRPPYVVEYEGKSRMIPAKIIDFQEITINKPIHLSYGCEGGNS